MNRNLFATFLLLSSTAAFSAGAYPSDATFAKQELELRQMEGACDKTSKNIAQRMKCKQMAHETMLKKYAMRGTHSYFLVNYSQLPFSAITAKHDELVALAREARSEKDFAKSTDRPAGELTKEMLQVEATEIDAETTARGGCSFAQKTSDECERRGINFQNETRKTRETDPHYQDLLKKLGL